MELSDVLAFIDLEDERLEQRFANESRTKREAILARTVKLTEELGELCDQVLAFNGDQRKEKLAAFDAKNLSGEFADVIITTLLLAKSMGVDVRDGLAKTIEKVNKRHEEGMF